MFKISNEKARGELIQSRKCQPVLQHFVRGNSGKTRCGYLLYGWQIVSANATISQVIHFSWDSETKWFPRCGTWTSFLGPRTSDLRGEHLTAPQPLHLRVHLNDHCWTEHELCCWASPQRQIWVTITCISLHVSKMPTLLQYLADGPQMYNPCSYRPSKASRTSPPEWEWIKPNNP